MGLRAIYPKRRTSSPGDGHKIYPYLLRGMKGTKPRQVYAADITYIPMAKGFLYLVAVIDWHSRKALAHRLSNTMDAAFASKRWKKSLSATAHRISSTPIRERSLPHRRSPVRSRHTACASLWTARAAGSTMCTWSASVAQPQAGRGLPARVRDGGRGREGDCRLPALLQRRASSPGT